MLIGLPAFAMVQIYSSTLRECGQTILPMKAGVAAVIVNLLFNYILIYGKFGAPALGVRGAAIATVLSRYVEMLIIVIGVHRKSHNTYSFVAGLYSTLKVPKELILKIIKKKGRQTNQHNFQILFSIKKRGSNAFCRTISF